MLYFFSFYYISAFILMIVLAAIRLNKGKGQGHPAVANFSGIPNLFGVCIYTLYIQSSLTINHNL